MKIAKLLLVFAMLLPIAMAQNARIEMPNELVENEIRDIHFVVNSPSPFSGIIYLTFNNLELSMTLFSFSDIGFSNGIYNQSLSAKGISEGIYSLHARLTNASGDTVFIINKTGTVNSTIPKIVSSSPSGIVSKESIVLTLKTNEISLCKYDTINTTFSNMTYTFTNTNSFYHNATISGLAQGDKIYFVKCQDALNNIMQEPYQLRFFVDVAPTAEVVLSEESPVREGVLEIELIVSEGLENAPTLEYTYSDEPNAKKPISLTGSGSKWKGYVVITEEDDNKIGTFYFSGIDSSGISGTKITKGNLFVVDTRKPLPPISLRATSQPDRSIRLDWYYEGEPVDYFRIYRSSNPGVNYVDYYTNTDEDSNKSQSGTFIDYGAIDKVTYYYKVSTIDIAGNEGWLSEEIYATAIDKVNPAAESVPDIEIPKVLPPNLHPIVDEVITQVESMLIDVNEVLNQINVKSGEERVIITELKIPESVISTKAKLDETLSQLKGFKKVYATEQELFDKLGPIKTELKRIEKTTPKNAQITEKSDFEQVTTNEDVQKAVDEFLAQQTFTQAEKETYSKKNLKEKTKAKISSSIKIYEITYLDGSKSDKTLIRKKISYENDQMPNDVIIIESVPKSIAASASELNFGSQNFEILQNDPIIKFGFYNFRQEGEEVYYYLDKRIDLEEVKNTRTVFLLSLNSMIRPAAPTGNSIRNFELNSINNILVWIGATVILGLCGYYFIFIKDYKYTFRKLGRQWTLKKLQRESEIPELPQAPSDDVQERLLNMLKNFNEKSNKNDDYKVILVNSLIDQAHSYMDNGLHKEAMKVYPQINTLYSQLPKEQKGLIFTRCTNLHQRMKR